MRLSTIVVSWNTVEVTLRCLDALYAATPDGLAAEVIVVDNASSDGSADAVERAFPAVSVIRRSENGGFARANNEGIAGARGRFLLLLNSDAMPAPGAIERLLGHLQTHPACGMVAPQLRNGDGSLQASCWRFPRWDTAALEALYLYRLMPRRKRGERLLAGYWEHDVARPVDWVMGAAMLVRRAVVDAVGGLDERCFMFGEDLEWCWRIRRAGWEVHYEPAAQVVHLGGQSSRQRYGDSEARVKHEAYYHFCRRNLGRGHTAALRTINGAGALLRLGLFQTRRLLQPSHEWRPALELYRTALRAHLGVRDAVL
jgi:N-acetylglucosaminyl-diphospho-decaprenol L-rhamnosyltransferase